MSHERFPRRVDLAIWLATLAFLGFAMEVAAAPPPAATAAPNAAATAAAKPKAVPPPTPREAWQRECGDCHIAYPARLLPAADWRRIVGTLDSHFGVDASLDAATTAAIAAWLETNAGRARPEAAGKAIAATTPAPLPRISTTPWFRHEHDEIAASTWKRPSIGSPARCEACHTDAAQGRFSEHALSIPR